MVETYQHFGRRVKKLNRKNALMANGYYTTMRDDGLVIARPVRRSVGFPFRSILLFLAVFICFKAFVLSSIGFASYESRLDLMKRGTVVEQAGAWALGLDPLTQVISAKIGPIFRD